MKELKIKCECGTEFERPAKYVEYRDNNKYSVHWKWKLIYCDICFKKRVKRALSRLPEIIKELANKT